MFPYYSDHGFDKLEKDEQYRLYSDALERINSFERTSVIEGELDDAGAATQKEPLTKENLVSQFLLAIKIYRQTGEIMQQLTNMFDSSPRAVWSAPLQSHLQQRPDQPMQQRPDQLMQHRPGESMLQECDKNKELLSLLNKQFDDSASEFEENSFKDYLYRKQRESGLEGKKFFDFLMFLSTNQEGLRATYETYFYIKDRQRKQREREQRDDSLTHDQNAVFIHYHEIYPGVTIADFLKK